MIKYCPYIMLELQVNICIENIILCGLFHYYASFFIQNISYTTHIQNKQKQD